MSARNRFLILLGIIFVIAATYYFFSTSHTSDLVLIGTVDANQVIVSAQVAGSNYHVRVWEKLQPAFACTP